MREQEAARSRRWRTLGAALLAAAVSLPLVVLGLPLLAVGVLAARFVIVGAILLGVTGCTLLYLGSGRFRGRLQDLIEPDISYKGLRLPGGVGLHPAHCWARLAPDGAFVGLDDLAQSCLGPVERVELPAVGQRLARGETLFSVRSGARTLHSPSPVEGTVVAVNATLEQEPGRVNSDPFGLGWIARLEVEHPVQTRRRLLHGWRAEQTFRSHVDQVVGRVRAAAEPALTMADGGELVCGLHQLIDADTWELLRRQLFSCPGQRPQRAPQHPEGQS